MNFSLTGNLVAIGQRRIFPARLEVVDGIIASITPVAALPQAPYILPGFIDAHVHIESSMLVPSEFARLAVVHGTVATVSDPHEIANVCGLAGVHYMIENGKTTPFKFFFGAPSCVPATSFETAGATLDAADVESLMEREEIKYLSEMMNFPGVLNGDEEVLRKIAAARKQGKPVDGHAPGLRGEAAQRYIAAGISTDHECFTLEEALDKIQGGMKIIIREGSAAKNFEALASLLHSHPHMVLFCSDDKHPDSLVSGHINQLCARAVARGFDVFNVLQAACVNPVTHYQLPVGLLQPGNPADFIVVTDLQQFEVQQTYINGQLVADQGRSAIPRQPISIINNFHCSPLHPQDLAVPWQGETTLPVIEALDGQLITNKLPVTPKVAEGFIVSDVDNDVLKMVVVNRYHPAPAAKAFIKNFGLKSGALASSVAHDSHNIVAVGTDDESLCRAINAVIASEGGIACMHKEEWVLPLPVAGLMSTEDGYTVAEKYAAIDQVAKDLGSSLSAPFMTLSFMALLVIPHLKLSDKGLFDGDAFSFL
ncbi:adenine deaminase [Paraflavisolibacter sp. H34]|uniref:adenine deaminase n=1 Tax=Huijunlia imazamoxiresistens TaxID=3127457 RepID=UPI0030183500